jgi:hypothetical protein
MPVISLIVRVCDLPALMTATTQYIDLTREPKVRLGAPKVMPNQLYGLRIKHGQRSFLQS